MIVKQKPTKKMIVKTKLGNLYYNKVDVNFKAYYLYDSNGRYITTFDDEEIILKLKAITNVNELEYILELNNLTWHYTINELVEEINDVYGWDRRNEIDSNCEFINQIGKIYFIADFE